MLKAFKTIENGLFWKEVEALTLEAFPPEEYLPPKKLIEMSKTQSLDFWTLADGEKFVGFMVVKTHANTAYLFFLAIDPSHRSQGYGGIAIKTLKSLYPEKQQVVDFEMLDENASNYTQRAKRRAFYLKNGYCETGLFLSYLGVDYEVFCMGEQFDEKEFKALLATLQIEGFHPKYFRKPS